MVERISRREFLEQTSLVGAAAVLGTDPKDFPRRVLGRTGVRVPVLAMGCGSRFLSYESEDAAAAAINLALERTSTDAPDSFRPPPTVHSAVVRLVTRNVAELDALNEAGISGIVAQAFSTRRKTLRNNLSGLISPSELAELGIDPDKRAQSLPVAAFVTIANRLAQRRT